MIRGSSLVSREPLVVSRNVKAARYFTEQRVVPGQVRRPRQGNIDPCGRRVLLVSPAGADSALLEQRRVLLSVTLGLEPVTDAAGHVFAGAQRTARFHGVQS